MRTKKEYAYTLGRSEIEYDKLCKRVTNAIIELTKSGLANTDHGAFKGIDIYFRDSQADGYKESGVTLKLYVKGKCVFMNTFCDEEKLDVDFRYNNMTLTTLQKILRRMLECNIINF